MSQPGAEISPVTLSWKKSKRLWEDIKQRKRYWFSLEKAAMLVEDDDLASLIATTANTPKVQNVLE